MTKINTEKVSVEYRNHVTKNHPIKGRKYTVTHSDDTGELFVTVGGRYAMDKIGSLRDELLLNFEEENNKIILSGQVLVDGEGISDNSKMRNEIFLRELGIALQAIRFGDRALFEAYPILDQVPIFIWFRSEQEEYNAVYDFGTMELYK